MAQQRILLGHVKGDKGDPGTNGTNGRNGIDAKIASATATVTPGHLDEPTCTVAMGGETGAQTMTLTFAGLQGPKGDTGSPGPAGSDGAPGKDGAAGAAGKDANIAAVNVTVKPGHSDSPTATATVSGDAGSKTIAITFDGLQGATGPAGAAGAAGPAGPAGPAGQNATTTATATQSANGLMSSDDKKKLDGMTGGAATSVVLADGTTKTIASLLQDNIETIRTALGVATTSKNGLLPKLPSNPNA